MFLISSTKIYSSNEKKNILKITEYGKFQSMIIHDSINVTLKFYSVRLVMIWDGFNAFEKIPFIFSFLKGYEINTKTYHKIDFTLNWRILGLMTFQHDLVPIDQMITSYDAKITYMTLLVIQNCLHHYPDLNPLDYSVKMHIMAW